MANRYWVGGTANWDGTAGTKWALTSGGLGGQTVPTSADDVFFDANSGTGTCTISTGNTGAKSINCTGFTGALAGTGAITVSGSVTLAAGMFMSYAGTMTLNGTATITSAGKAFGSVTIDGVGITVTLGDAFSVSTNTLTLTQGTFNAANFNVTVGSFSSSNTNTRTLTMGSGTWTVQSNATAWNTATTTGLTLNANTSTINMTATAGKTFAGGGLTYYNLSQAGSGLLIISGSNTFNDLTNTVSAADATVQITAGTTQTFTNFSYSATAPYSAFLISNTTGSTYTVSKSSGTVNANRLLIRDSVATGGATWNATSSVSLGNNTGWVITASTGRYWVGGTASWDGTAGTKWATSSGAGGGATVPGLVDPAYFDAASGVSTVTIALGNLGCAGFICTGFTGTLTGTIALSAYGNVTLVAGMTYTYTGTLSILGPSTVTSAGKTFGSTTVGSSSPASSHTVTLGDSLTLGTTITFTLTSGTLDLANLTLNTGIFSSSNSNTRSITFGTGNIALTSTTAAATVLSMATATGFTWTGTGGFTRNMAATATVNFGATAGGTVSNAPNLTVNAGSSALTITTGSYFKNLIFTGYSGTPSATYNAAGNLTLSTGGTYTSVTPTFLASGTVTSAGKTLGTVTANGAGITVTLADAMTPGGFTLTQGTLDLNGFTLTTGLFSSSNTNTRSISFGSANIVFTPNVGGGTVLSMGTATGFTWTGTGGFTRSMLSTTATFQFGSTSGGSVSNAPNLTLNAGGQTVTITSGSYFKNLNFTGSTSIVTATYNACGNLTLATGGFYTSVSPTFLASGTITSSGRALSITTINGSGITVTLADALSCNSLIVTLGTLNTTASNYAISVTSTTTVQGGTLSLNGSTLTNSAFTYTSGTVSAGTSLINCNSATSAFAGGFQTYYNVAFTSTAITTATVSGANTFNNLTIPARAATGISVVTFSANQIINGTFTVSAGANATCRTTIASNIVNVFRTLACAAVSLTDADFRDITIAGAAAPASGTRLGDLKNNSGITFTSKTVYWNLAGVQNWSAAGWALLSGGAPDINNFPLAQDTAVFDDAGSVTGLITVQIAWPIGTIDSLSRTIAMSFSLGDGIIFVPVYGDILIGSAVTLSNARPTFSGKNTQSVQTSGQTFLSVQLDSVGGVLTLSDNLTVTRNGAAFTLTNGTLDLNGKTLHQSSNGTSAGFFTGAGTKNITFNGGTILLKGGFSGAFRNIEPAGFTTTAGTGLGTIRFDNAFQPQFTGGGRVYNCTIDQAGSGPLTFFDGGNTVSDITNSYKATGATAIYFTAGTSNTFLNWNASGEAGRLLTVKSRTAATHTLVKTSGIVNVDYLSVSDSTATGGAAWYAGSNSTNVVNNSGWIFSSPPVFISETASASDVVAAVLTFLSSTSETATATDSFSAPNIILNLSLSETTTATDLISSALVLSGQISENANITDVTLVAPSVFGPQVQETVAALDSIPTICTFNGQLVESATALDSVNGAFLWNLVDDSQNPNWQNINTA